MQSSSRCSAEMMPSWADGVATRVGLAHPADSTRTASSHHPTQAPVQTGFCPARHRRQTVQGQRYAAWQEVQGRRPSRCHGRRSCGCCRRRRTKSLTAAANAASASLAAAAAAAPSARAAATPAAIDPLDLLEPVHQEPVHVVIKERISISGNRDGGLESLEIKGDLLLKITDPSLARFASNSLLPTLTTSSSPPAISNSRRTRRWTRQRVVFRPRYCATGCSQALPRQPVPSASFDGVWSPRTRPPCRCRSTAGPLPTAKAVAT